MKIPSYFKQIPSSFENGKAEQWALSIHWAAAILSKKGKVDPFLARTLFASSTRQLSDLQDNLDVAAERDPVASNPSTRDVYLIFASYVGEIRRCLSLASRSESYATEKVDTQIREMMDWVWAISW